MLLCLLSGCEAPFEIGLSGHQAGLPETGQREERGPKGSESAAIATAHSIEMKKASAVCLGSVAAISAGSA